MFTRAMQMGRAWLFADRGSGRPGRELLASAKVDRQGVTIDDDCGRADRSNGGGAWLLASAKRDVV